jgi:4-hydroxybenzoate polyprenyltransferase
LIRWQDGVSNLKGEAKAQALIEQFGASDFAYAGNDRADVAVWRVARQAVVVNAKRRVRSMLRRLADTPVEAEFYDQPSMATSMLHAMRPHQWIKNILVFVPMIMAHAVRDVHAWTNAFGMFLAFCATASSIYIMNDLADLADLTADRLRPRKRYRAIASGAVTVPVALIAAGVLLGLGLSLSAMIGMVSVVVLYAACSISYSIGLKEYPIVDVCLLAGLYTIRILGGGAATGHPISLWLEAFSGFLFLSLALVKRTGEMSAVLRSGGARVAARRGYVTEDVPLLQTFGCASTFASAVVLALFIGSDAAMSQYATPQLLWGSVPLVLFWQCRLWLSTARGQMHDDPIVYASRDWVSWLVAAVVLGLVAPATLQPLPVLSDFVKP